VAGKGEGLQREGEKEVENGAKKEKVSEKENRSHSSQVMRKSQGN